MSALEADRVVDEIEGRQTVLGAASGKEFFRGALLCRSATGYMTPGAAATTLVALGICDEYVDNSDGGDGDVIVTARAGTFPFANSADADEIADADVGNNCYIVNDQTVAKTSGSSTRSIAGRVVKVDADTGQVFVAIGLTPTNAPAGALLAANNLSDVTAAPARDNIAANKGWLSIDIADLVGGDAKVYRTVAPVNLTIEKIYTVLEGHALATGNATLTGKVNASAITGGVVTLLLASSAIGDVRSATPSAANTANAGDVISLTVGGTNDNASATAKAIIQFKY